MWVLSLGGNHRERPTLLARTRAEQRPCFKLATNAVHAGPKGTLFRLGVLGDQDGILAGARNVGCKKPVG
jgi:hypothetical protein